MRTKPFPKTFRFSTHASDLLIALAESMGVAQTQVLEIILREAAEKRGLKVRGRSWTKIKS